MNDILFFDLETIPDEMAVEYVDVKAPANYKDPDKIEAYLVEAKAEAISRMALDPDLGRIKAIAFKSGDDITTNCLLRDEKEMLEMFWELSAEHNNRLCGFNIISFDVPYLLRRSMALGVKTPLFGTTKYRNDSLIDLMIILYGREKPRGLKWLVKRYGIPNPLPELNGFMVGNMDNETLMKYAINDVNITYELYQRMKGVYL